MSRFNRRNFLLGAAYPALMGAQTANPQEVRIEPASLEFLERMLVTSSRRDEATMDEITARYAWVQQGRVLPGEVRARTILRANNPRPDKIKAFFVTMEDLGPTKRALCMAIIAKDDENRTNQKARDL